jgi:putative spermidine/putrescine transport system permease protein
MRLPQWARIVLLLSPALSVVLVLFGGGLVFGLMQSLNYFPIIGLKSFNFDAYSKVFGDKAFHSALFLSLRIAFISTFVASALAVACALLLRATRFGRRFYTFLFQLNLPIPHIVGAVAMLFLLSQSGLLSRLTHGVGLTANPAAFPALVSDPWSLSVIAEYVWKEVPFIGVVVLAALAAGIEEYEDVAKTLGAGRWRRFRYVTLPLVMPAVLSTSIIVFAFSFGSFEVPFLLGRPYPPALPVLSYQYYTNVDLNSRPQAMAINVLIAAIVTALIVVYMYLSDRYVRRRR